MLVNYERSQYVFLLLTFIFCGPGLCTYEQACTYEHFSAGFTAFVESKRRFAQLCVV